MTDYSEFKRITQAANAWSANYADSELFRSVTTPFVVLSLIAEVEALRSQVSTLQSDANSWQSGYDEGRRLGTKTALDEREELRKDAGRYRWLRVNEFDIGSYHPEGDHNHESWFEHFDDESIDRSIVEEAEFADESIGKGDQP